MGAAGEVRTAMPTMGERNQALNGAINFINDAVSGFGAIFAEVKRDFIDIDERLRMEVVIAHAGPLRRASILSCKRAKASSPSINFTLPLLMSS